MDNQRIGFTPEVIAQQRAICDAATPGPWAVSVANEYPYDDIGSGLTGEHVALCGSKAENSKFIIDARTILPAALDALESSMAREAEKDATITTQKNIVELLRSSLARLTAERDAAVKDLTTAMTNMYIDGRGDETDICWACKFAMRDKGTFPCNSCINYEMAEFTHRGACKDE